MLKEFRAFIARGNVMDLAVAVVMGAAFARVVSSFVGGVAVRLSMVARPAVAPYRWRVIQTEKLT